MQRGAATVVLIVTLLAHTLPLAAPEPVSAARHGSVLAASAAALDSTWVTTTGDAAEILGTPRAQRIPSPDLRSTGQGSPKRDGLAFSTAPRLHRSPYPTRTRLRARLAGIAGGDRPH
jgi:hypothetical protein